MGQGFAEIVTAGCNASAVHAIGVAGTVARAFGGTQGRELWRYFHGVIGTFPEPVRALRKAPGLH